MSFSILLLSAIQLLSSFCPVTCGYNHAKADDASQLRVYIVHVLPPSNAPNAGPTDLESYYKSFLPDSISESGETRLIYSYSEVLSGFAAKLTQDEVDSMAKNPGFVRAYPDMLIPLLTTHTPDFLGLHQGRGLWQPSGLGKGVIIGVLDTGLHATHPSFNDDGVPPPPSKWKGSCEFPAGCNNKLIGAKTFNNSGSGAPDDGDGHGTHTASTAAGNFVQRVESFGLASGTSAGMAPHAHLAIYKVCGPAGCSTSDVLAGLDEAVKDGVDVLSLSLGGSSVPFYLDPIAIGAFGATEKGILVTCAAGNSGPSDSTLSNEAPWILTVAASSVDRNFRSIVTLGNGEKLYGESLNQPKSFKPSSLPLVYPNEGACTVDFANIFGKVVLCDADVDEYGVTASIKDAGGAAVIFLNDNSSAYSIVLRDLEFPSPKLTYEDASKVKRYVNTTRNPTASITFNGTILGVSPAPVVAYFSSRGPSTATPGILKPDISGPGLNIMAAWPVQPETGENGTKTFNIISGTSMATPHLSGIAALIKSAHPDWSPAAIKSAIMTTSYVVGDNRKPIPDEQHLPASFFAMGAGHVNPSNAADPGLIYDLDVDDYIRYLCGLYNGALVDRNVGGVIRRRISCSKFGSISEAELNYPSLVLPPGSTVNRTVTNVGKANDVYRVEVEAPKGAKVTVTPATLTFSKVKEKKTFTVRVTGGKSGLAGNLRWISGRHVVRSPIVIVGDAKDL
ncbi:subtilisin-like protease [Elaeis guineensis]|uniref:Subtilisin-like protease SBT1.7 n=1 Tax=Elaeis guineensis var. tenera TaxID=51953 RepID=A0A6I9R2L7_ELAGV|nr:subtilisin-like protease SBT1.7 [Elaeis guineensis]